MNEKQKLIRKYFNCIILIIEKDLNMRSNPYDIIYKSCWATFLFFTFSLSVNVMFILVKLFHFQRSVNFESIKMVLKYKACLFKSIRFTRINTD